MELLRILILLYPKKTSIYNIIFTQISINFLRILKLKEHTIFIKKSIVKNIIESHNFFKKFRFLEQIFLSKMSLLNISMIANIKKNYICNKITSKVIEGHTQSSQMKIL